MNIKMQVCPFCNGTEFVEGKQMGNGAIMGDAIVGCSLYHTICRNCGSVVRTYVEDPEKLLKRKNRRY